MLEKKTKHNFLEKENDFSGNKSVHFLNTFLKL